jgi:two-component system, OmpR family, sensor histidine kinase ChvG
MKRAYVGLRGKVLLVSCVLLAIPWVGYQYVGQMENFLREGQERALSGTARAVATALHDRPQLFEHGRPSASRRGAILAELPGPISLDGRTEDWAAAPVTASLPASSARESGFELKLGKFERNVYALIQVADSHLSYRRAALSSPDAADHLELTVIGSDGALKRYIVSAAAPGPLQAYFMPLGSPEPARPEPRIEGIWQENTGGYTLELRLPLAMVGTEFKLAIADADSPSPRLRALAGVALPSSEIELIIKGLERASSRIRVIDRSHRVVAQAGSLKGDIAVQLPLETSALSSFERRYLHPLYALILPEPVADFSDDGFDAIQLHGRDVEAALSGILATRWRRTEDDRAYISSAAHPVWNDDKVVGAVVVEETTQAIQTIRNRALERLFTVTLIVFVLGSLTLFLFASRLSARIRRLRDDSERVIDSHGRVKGDITPSTSGDELGDLSRSFHGLLTRLRQHTGYLESLASRLSHELRTPIAVVRSSLDNLRGQDVSREQNVYIGRAGEGLSRLTTILTRMTEASKLEQSLQSAEPELFDLAKVVSGCVEGYRAAYPVKAIVLRGSGEALWVNGVPDLIAQLLDKLVANAVDFAAPDSSIHIELVRENGCVSLRVLNEGPPLPLEMSGGLFQSMVSIRPHQDSPGPHLGLGLYIVRLITEFHRGEVSAANRQDRGGVAVTVRLPLGRQAHADSAA